MKRMKISAIRTLVYRQKFVWPGIFIAIFLTACGYHFSGSGSLPEKVQTVAVDMLKNRTTETGLENIITNDLINEFVRKGRSVEKNSKKADAVLSGVIESSRITTISRQAQQSAVARQVQLAVSLKLTSRDGRVIWSASGISDYEAYNVGADSYATDINKRQAIQTLSQRLVEKVYNRLTENF
jgi:outer membrane lipopolysaccharide assembly protein LptE/RlpB